MEYKEIVEFWKKVAKERGINNFVDFTIFIFSVCENIDLESIWEDICKDL